MTAIKTISQEMKKAGRKKYTNAGVIVCYHPI